MTHHPAWRPRLTRLTGCLGAFALAMCAVPSAAHAQTGQTAQIPLQFDFLNPGARSLALGSAFVAVADDATAAFTNPAGLTLSPRREVSVELRYRRLDTPYLAGGRLSGTPSGKGIDTISGPVYGISADPAFRPYFLSFVYPRGRLAVSGYRHEIVLQTNTFISRGPFYRSASSAGIFDNARLPGLSGDRDIGIVTYGFTAAYRVSPHLSLGEGIVLYRFRLDSHFGALDFQDGLFTPIDPTTFGKSSTTTQDGSGLQAAFNVGALVTLNRKVRVAGVVRQGSSFLFDHMTHVPSTGDTTQVGSFRTPAVVGGGVRLDPTDAWTFAIDYDWVQYSRLVTNFIQFQVEPAVVSRVSIHDGNEIHFGAEYTFLQTANKLTLRGGVWFDPDHAVQYASDGTGSDTDTRLQAVFPGGTSVWHYCAGFGLPLSRAYEVNVGSDFTSQRRYVSASLVARFGK